MNPNLLLTGNYQNQPLVQKFMDTDTRELYIKNFTSLSDFRAQWKARPITYTTNSDHYRCPEWEDIVWNDSILMLGCSVTFGVGLDDSDTISSHLSSYLGGIPVVNLGQGGSSWTFQWINTVRLVAAGIRPRAVVYIWPDVSRYTRMLDSKLARHTGSWSAQGLGLEYLKDTDHAQAISGEILACVRALWSCPQLHYTWSPQVDPNWSVPRLTAPIDRARDRMHPGPETAGIWAGNIARDLGELNSSFLLGSSNQLRD